jgi:hypothetical protein
MMARSVCELSKMVLETSALLEYCLAPFALSTVSLLRVQPVMQSSSIT